MASPARGAAPRPGHTLHFGDILAVLAACPWVLGVDVPVPGVQQAAAPLAKAPGAGGKCVLLGVPTVWWLRSLGSEPSSCALQICWGQILPFSRAFICSLSAWEWINRSAWPASMAGVPLAGRVLGKHREGK